MLVQNLRNERLTQALADITDLDLDKAMDSLTVM